MRTSTTLLALVLVALFWSPGSLTCGRASADPASPAPNSPSSSVEQGDTPDLSARIADATKSRSVADRLKQLSDIGSKLNLPEVPAALQRATGLGELREQMVFRLAVLQQWSSLDPAAAFAYVAKLPGGQLKAVALQTAADRLAHADPARAAAMAAAMGRGSARNNTLQLIGNVWAMTDSNAALQWAQGLQPDSARQSTLNTIYYVRVKQDPQAASQVVAALPLGDTRTNLIGGVAFAWTSKSPKDAIRWSQSIPDAAGKAYALSNVAESWAMTDTGAAAAFALGLTGQDQRGPAAASVASSWAKQDPKAAAKWAWDSVDKPIRSSAVNNVVDIWAPADAQSCSDWLAGLPAGSDRDLALRHFISTASVWTPDLCARDSMLISDMTSRMDAVYDAMGEWMQVDPESALKWIQTGKWPEGFVNRWLRPA